MSTAGSTSTLPPQSPLEEMKERAAESFPAWQIPRLVAVQHLQSMLASSRRRVNDSHKLQMAKLKEVTGYEGELGEGEGDDVGDIIIQGDTHYTMAAEKEKPANEPSTLGTVAEKGGKVASWVVALSMLGGGTGLGYVIHDLFSDEPPAVVDTDTDTDTISVIDLEK